MKQLILDGLKDFDIENNIKNCKGKYIKICKYCYNRFITSSNGKLFCGPDCRDFYFTNKYPIKKRRYTYIKLNLFILKNFGNKKFLRSDLISRLDAIGLNKEINQIDFLIRDGFLIIPKENFLQVNI